MLPRSRLPVYATLTLPTWLRGTRPHDDYVAQVVTPAVPAVPGAVRTVATAYRPYSGAEATVRTVQSDVVPPVPAMDAAPRSQLASSKWIILPKPSLKHHWGTRNHVDYAGGCTDV